MMDRVSRADWDRRNVVWSLKSFFTQYPKPSREASWNPSATRESWRALPRAERSLSRSSATDWTSSWVSPIISESSRSPTGRLVTKSRHSRTFLTFSLSIAFHAPSPRSFAGGFRVPAVGPGLRGREDPVDPDLAE